MFVLIIKTIVFIPISFLLSIAGWVVAPIAPLFRNEDYRLPDWLAWCSTPHTNLLGDAGHRERWKGKPEYLQMVAWIFRNPSCVAQQKLLGFDMKETDTYKLIGDPKTSDNGGHSGSYFVRVFRDGNTVCYQHYAVFQYPFCKTKCWRSILGWKLWANPAPSDVNKQYSFIIQPWKHFNTNPD